MWYTDILSGKRRSTEYCYRAMTDDRNAANSTVVETCFVRQYNTLIFK
jgi:hypothetical protein